MKAVRLLRSTLSLWTLIPTAINSSYKELPSAVTDSIFSSEYAYRLHLVSEESDLINH